MSNNTNYSHDPSSTESSEAGYAAGSSAPGDGNADRQVRQGEVVPSQDEKKDQEAKGESPARTQADGGGKKVVPGVPSRVQKEPAPKRIAPVFVDFQPDAVELETQPVPGRLRWVLYTVGFLLLTTVGWAYWTEIEMFVTAQGELVPTTEPIMIQAAAGSPIKEIHVSFGDIVRPGQLLATLDASVAEADEASFSARLNSARARMDRLIAEQEGLREFDISAHAKDADWIAEQSLFISRWLAYETQLEEIAAEIQGHRAQIEGNDDEVVGLQSALRIHLQVEETMRKLSESGSQSVNNYLSQKLNRQEVDMKIVNLENESKQLLHSIAAAEKRRERVTAERVADINDKIVKTRNEITMLETDLEKAVRARRLSQLNVPSDTPYSAFYVLEASDRTSGSVVRETDPLFKLMPLDDKLRVEAEIQGKDIGDVRLGDMAIIKLDALPYQRHGTLKGTLATVSEGSFEKKEGAAETSFFKSYVTLTERRIENPPEGFRLVPGMTCKVELRVGKRRVIDYFLYPLIRHLDQSLREPSARPQQQDSAGAKVESKQL